MANTKRSILIVAHRRRPPPPRNVVVIEHAPLSRAYPSKPEVTLWGQIKRAFIWFWIVSAAYLAICIMAGFEKFYLIVPVAGGIAIGAWGHLVVWEIKKGLYAVTRLFRFIR